MTRPITTHIAPPLTLTLLMSRSNLSTQYAYLPMRSDLSHILTSIQMPRSTARKLSHFLELTSQRSTSSFSRPARRSTALPSQSPYQTLGTHGMAATGPTPMTLGDTPTTLVAM